MLYLLPRQCTESDIKCRDGTLLRVEWIASQAQPEEYHEHFGQRPHSLL